MKAILAGPIPRNEGGDWRATAVDAVGNAIEFWGFKRNQGRVWAHLYLAGEPMEASRLQRELGLSKGAVSMVTRELEGWGVVHRVRAPGSATWRFAAETDLMRMLGKVLSEREVQFVGRVRADLEAAEAQAKRAGHVPREVVERLTRLRMLAQLAEKAIGGFIRTARLDVNKLVGVLRRPGQIFGGSP